MKWKKRDNASTIEQVVCRNLGIADVSEIDKWMHRKYMFYGLDEIDSAVMSAIRNKIPIHIIGDYDVDGTMSTTIMLLGLQALGADVTYRIPRRFSEGYGLSEKIIDEIDSGLVITVDNGIAAIKAIQKAKEKGLQVIVTDHHLRTASGELPDADYILDLNAIDGQADFKGYCGAGLAYKIMEYMLPRHVEEAGSLLKKLLGMAAIATVADIMELREENYVIVKKGLKTLLDEDGRTPGLDVLMRCIEMNDNITETDFGFNIGPVMNASGRLHDKGGHYVVDLLRCPDDTEVQKNWMLRRAVWLKENNETRKAIVEEIFPKVCEEIESTGQQNDYPLVVYVADCPEGIIGLIAGRLAEKYKTPCLLCSDGAKEGVLKGSGRSYGDYNLKAHMDKNKDCFLGYGGHKDAAGFSLQKNDLDRLRQSIQEEKPKVDDCEFYDLEIGVDEIRKCLEILDKYAPYGQGNARPVFKIRDFEAVPNGSNHYRVMGKTGTSVKIFGRKADAVAFGMKASLKEIGYPKDLILYGTLGRNFFRGEGRDQIECMDFEKREKEKRVTNLQAMINRIAQK